MDIAAKFDGKNRTIPFRDYEEYMDYLFTCVNVRLEAHIRGLMEKYDAGQGKYKNVLYPDIEIAYDLCSRKIGEFIRKTEENGNRRARECGEGSRDAGRKDFPAPGMLPLEEEASLGEAGDGMEAQLEALLEEFGEKETGKASGGNEKNLTAAEMLSFIDDRLAVTDTEEFRFHELCKRQRFDPFTVFALACSLLSSTQTSYASVFQIVNENGSQNAPTVESAGRLYFGDRFSITGSYGEMSVCLEQLLPVLDLKGNAGMPFSAVLAPDKRLIDYLFGREPYRPDENYNRFFKMLTDKKELGPVMANMGRLEAMEISADRGVRIFNWYGDEGSGRKFFIRHYCRRRGLSAMTVNCRKLFGYDYGYVDRALWSAARECIFTGSCCCLDGLDYREEEKQKFSGYLDLALSRLGERDITVFLLSREPLPLKEATDREFTQLFLETPSNQEREDCWRYFGAEYALAEEVELPEMATKFLFTPGKIAAALKYAAELTAMNRETEISRQALFCGCNNQMSAELTQKATKVQAKFGFEDIVMNDSQKETLLHAIDQMNFRKQVYDNWNYTKKYPYGRGLSILLFGAPGTGKSMCAQVIAHELNLELYRVDLSKVIDKYVGETEKSISMIFREAKKCNVVLFFDECDTLFAKRSDDGGSSQSSNNNKTALLLQEVEAYDGVSVLATNYKHNIDPAFFRRMKYIVEFQFPDPDTREMLWRTTIPKGTPLDDDVDIRFLAERFEFVGGNIKNCILNAAFLAAADGGGKRVGMKHYLQAIKYEFVKTGKVFTKADFEPYADLVGLGKPERV